MGKETGHETVRADHVGGAGSRWGPRCGRIDAGSGVVPNLLQLRHLRLTDSRNELLPFGPAGEEPFRFSAKTLELRGSPSIPSSG
jgi:hypothetical protein